MNINKTKYFVLQLILFFISNSLLSQSGCLHNKSITLEKRLDSIIQSMIIEEKVAMCLGSESGGFKGVPRLNIPDMTWTDGPRGPHDGGIKSTAFPCGVAFGATWNIDLMMQVGAVMGKESRALGKNILFGPAINILRDPLGGRFFEYYSEDPYLTGQTGASIVKGVQNQKVAACLKHYVCNNREDNRNLYMSMADERVLREIYLPAFKDGVDAGAMTVMTAANGVNGEFVSDNHYLLQDILKDEWGFKGFVLTDWINTRSTQKAALAGLDVAMPYHPNSLFGTPLLLAVKNGQIHEDLINDKVRRILRVYEFVGLLDGIPANSGGKINTKEHQEIALRVAEESMVLLKNQGGVLPLDRKKNKKIVVLGPNADQRFCLVALGGSSWMESPYEITPLQGIRNIAGEKTDVVYISTEETAEFQLITKDFVQSESGDNGFDSKYFNNGEKQPSLSRIEENINFVWEMRSPNLEKVDTDHFRAEFTGKIIPPITGTYTFKLSADNNAWLWLDGAETPLAISDIDRGNKYAMAAVHMEAGKPFSIRVNYNEVEGDAFCKLEWSMPVVNNKYDESPKAIEYAVRDADAVIFVGGIDHSQDTESRDRENMEFPLSQQKLIKYLASINKKTIVVLINGSPLELGSWLEDVPAVLEAWYPGMEGGNAIGEILFGDVNPSGRLPFTWPRKLEDVPMYAVKTQNWNKIDYLEGIFNGYRYFETWDIEPEFPFGFGLSYTQFSYDDLWLSLDSINTNDTLEVKVKITNIGERKGAETIQLYVNENMPSLPRPLKELKGIKKVELDKKESKTVSFQLSKQDFSYYDVTKNQWKVNPGEFKIEIGSSCHEINLSKIVNVKK